MSPCSGAMLPSPGPPRMTFTMTPGTSAPIMYESPSSIRLKPGDDVNVIERRPAAAAAVHHVDRRDLADRLHEDAVELRQELRHQLGPFGRRRDRVAEEVAAAREQRADRRGVHSLHDERAGRPAAPPTLSGTVAEARASGLDRGDLRRRLHPSRPAARTARGRRRSRGRSRCSPRGGRRRGSGRWRDRSRRRARCSDGRRRRCSGRSPCNGPEPGSAWVVGSGWPCALRDTCEDCKRAASASQPESGGGGSFAALLTFWGASERRTCAPRGRVRRRPRSAPRRWSRRTGRAG